MGKRSTIESVSNDESRYAVNESTGCWIWNGAKMRSGHALVKVGGKLLMGHRVFYIHFVGQIAKGLELHHRCFRPACVNPAHLVPMSHGEHTRVHAKLSFEDADEIRWLYNDEGLSQREIASVYRVDQTTVSAVITGKTWADPNRVLATRS